MVGVMLMFPKISEGQTMFTRKFPKISEGDPKRSDVDPKIIRKRLKSSEELILLDPTSEDESVISN